MPNRLELLGSTPAASVTVNGSATVRQAERYGIEIPVNNSTSATQVNLTVTATQGAESLSKTLKRDHPAANQAYSYDSDGNLLNDGIWAYSWDAENRLISSEYQLATTNADKRKYNYVYDHQSRRVLKRELLWNTTRSTWYAERQTKYIYDGWNVVVELFNENTVWKKHTWGLDLSGSMQGAGGVGGLLATENILKNYAAALTYDGNGNVTTLVKKDTSTLLAEYEYTAFGRTLTKSGKHANDNLYRFSTKPQEAHNNWYYYGYRYYDPTTGRWPSRDPIEEDGGNNLYGFVGNNSINQIDILGEKLSLATGKYKLNSLPANTRTRSKTDVDFTPNITTACDDFGFQKKLEFDGGLNVTVHSKPEDVKHEEIHVKKYGEWWDAFVKNVNQLEGEGCCCSERLAALMAAQNIFRINAEIDNLGFDKGEYKSIQNERRLAHLKTKKPKAKKAYSDALKVLAACELPQNPRQRVS